MSSRHLVDPELLDFLDAFPSLELKTESLPQVRDFVKEISGLINPEPFGVVRVEVHLPRSGVRCLIYRPQHTAHMRGALIYLHGGGYVLGSVEESDLQNLETVKALGIVIIAVDYRLAPEHPYPAALNDSYDALTWAFQNADALGIDSNRIGVSGDSAGGGLAATLALKTRDEGIYHLKFQHLVYPMLDDRTGKTMSDAFHNLGEYIWTASNNQFGWSAYLGGQNPLHCIIPSRANDLSALPPTWIAVGSLDLFLNENIDYARKLMASDVSAELQIYPGGFHAFPLVDGSQLAKRFWRDYRESLARGLAL
jgi:acetyl esterase/lipase